jgi:hypothetical protein
MASNVKDMVEFKSMPDECMGARVCIVLSFFWTKEPSLCTLNQVFMSKKSCEFSKLRYFKVLFKKIVLKNHNLFSLE